MRCEAVARNSSEEVEHEMWGQLVESFKNGTVTERKEQNTQKEL